MNDSVLKVRYERLVSQWRAFPRDERHKRMEALIVPATYNSTRIENDEITLRDTAEVLKDGSVVNFTGKLRALYEIDNHGRAWREATGLVERGPEALTIGSVLGLQATLTEHTYDADRWAHGERPGTYKVRDYGVGIDAAVGLPPEECPGAMEELLEEVSPYLKSSGLEANKALTIATYLHARMVEIHPFADGNGRCARLVENMALGFMGCPPIVQRQEDRMAYYGALDSFHSEGNLQPLVQFNRVETILTWRDGFEKAPKGAD